jgi:small-conductance mechanosensitive channel
MDQILDHTLFRIAGTPLTLGSILTSFAILAGSWVLARVARQVIAHRLLGKAQVDLGVRYAIGRILGYVILFLGIVMSLQTLGINSAVLAVFSGALGIGLGIGLQDIAKNFISGIIILIERPVQIGDRIEIGDLNGDVVEIRARATVIRTNDDVHLIVPNSRFISDAVTNRSFGRRRVRYGVPIGVSYGSDPRAVEAALLEAARRSPNTLSDPAPTVWFLGFGDSSLDFELRCWTETMLNRPRVFTSEVNFLIHEELKKRGIEIPFPQRDLHIRSAPALDGLLAGRPKDDREA